MGAIASPDTIVQEDRFIKMLNEELPPDRPAMATEFHEPLPEVIQLLRHDMGVREAGRYHHHTVYEVRPLTARIRPTPVCSQNLTFTALSDNHVNHARHRHSYSQHMCEDRQKRCAFALQRVVPGHCKAI